MTVFKSTDGLVVGQPISPFFGAQNGIQGAGAPVVQAPLGVNPVVPALDSVSRGSLPANALVNTVNGVSVGGNVTVTGYDPCSVSELMSSGNGNQANGGVGQGSDVPQQSEQQQYAANQTVVANTENGPAPVNVDTLGLAPVPGGTATNQITLNAGVFIG